MIFIHVLIIIHLFAIHLIIKIFIMSNYVPFFFLNLIYFLGNFFVYNFYFICLINSMGTVVILKLIILKWNFQCSLTKSLTHISWRIIQASRALVLFCFLIFWFSSFVIKFFNLNFFWSFCFLYFWLKHKLRFVNFLIHFLNAF